MGKEMSTVGTHMNVDVHQALQICCQINIRGFLKISVDIETVLVELECIYYKVRFVPP